jgi:hypothetical protein
VPGLHVKRNDVALDDAAWGQRTPVDPDDYTITAEADGYAPWTTHVTVKTKNRRIEVPALDKQETKAPDDQPAKKSTATAAEVAPPPPIATESHLRKGPIVVATVGVAAIGAGVVLGLLSKSDENSANTTCPLVYCGDQSAIDQTSRARSEALGADIGLAVGGAALAGAVVWWLVAGPSVTEHVAVLPTFDHPGIALEGRF